MQGALNEGLTAGGVDVLDIGMCVTPMSYYACATLKANGAVQNTASHNPGNYSGFKLSREEARPVSYETGIAQIEELVTSGNLKEADTKGTVKQVDVWSDYKKWLLSRAKDVPSLKVVVDTGNGVAGVRMKEIFDALPCELIGLYLEPDGSFPNHEANPLNEDNMRDLQAAVREHNADLGAAFDGDGDRVMFVDDRGELVRSDHLTAVMAGDILEENPGAPIVYDLRSSWVVAEEIRRHGGKPLESRVGHSFIKALMREEDSPFAGELSGHYYFRDAYYTDNAELALMVVLNHLGRTGKKISDAIADMQRYHATGEINYVVDDTAQALEKIASTFEDADVSRLDGVTVRFDDWWFNVRPSNTEPLLRLNLEAKTPAQMTDGRKQVESIIGGKPAAGH
jgi:phosphomannomutase